MSNPFSRLFLDHPREVGESYGEHFAMASRYGAKLMALAGCCFVHAVAPALFKTTVSANIRRMAAELGGRADTACDERVRRDGAWDPGL